MIVYSVFGKRSPMSIESNDGNLKSEKTWFLLSSNTVTTYDKAIFVFKSNRGQLKNPDISGALYTLRIQYSYLIDSRYLSSILYT